MCIYNPREREPSATEYISYYQFHNHHLYEQGLPRVLGLGRLQGPLLLDLVQLLLVRVAGDALGLRIQ